LTACIPRKSASDPFTVSGETMNTRPMKSRRPNAVSQVVRRPVLRRVVLGCMALALAGSAQGARPAAQSEVVAAVGERTEIGPRCRGEAARPAQVALQMGKSTLMRLPEAVQNRSVGNPA